MKFTENFNLNLPDLDDMADVEKLNENFQTIDSKMKSLETDPELAANVVDIKNKIGEESDADTQPTLFGRLAQLKKVLLEKLAELLTKVTGIDGKIGTSGDTAGTATLFGQIKAIVDTLAGKKYVYSDTVQKTYNNISLTTDGNSKIKKSIIIASFDAEYDGTLRFTGNISLSDSYSNASFITFYAISSSTWFPNGSLGYANIEDVLGKPEGTSYSKTFSGASTAASVKSGNYSKTFTRFTGAGETEPFSLLLHCQKGDKVALVVDIYMEYKTTLKVQDIKLKYDVK